MVADIEELETMDESEIYSKRHNAKEVIFPKENEKIIFPVADGRINLAGRGQELRTSTLIRYHPIGGESHVDFSWRIKSVSLHHLKTHFRMPVKRLTISGPCQETLYTAITLKRESNFTR